MEQLTKRQRTMLVNGLDALDNDLGKDGGFWNDETDGPRPSPSEIAELARTVRGLPADESAAARHDPEELSIRFRGCYVLAEDLSEVAESKIRGRETLHATVIERVSVPAVLQEPETFDDLVVLLTNNMPGQLLVIRREPEELSTYCMDSALTDRRRHGEFRYDPVTDNYYCGRGRHAIAVLDRLYPAPKVTEVHRVVAGLLRTDAGQVPPLAMADNVDETDYAKLTLEVASWTAAQRADAFEWAALSHYASYSNDDDVVVPPCPPHVQKIRPVYGKPAGT